MSKNFESTEFIKALESKIDELSLNLSPKEYGIVAEVGDGIAVVANLTNVSIGEKVSYLKDGVGMVMSVDEKFSTIILFNKLEEVIEGIEVFATGKKFSIKVGNNLIGRVVDPLINALDGLGKVDLQEERVIDAEVPGIMERKSVCEPLATGIALIDSLIPIGLGQKQLILGDRQTGKTTIALDTMLNQKNVKENNSKHVICIYVAISKKNSDVAKIHHLLKEKGILDNTIIVSVTASESSAMKYIAPMVGTTIAEYFRDQKKDALVIFDDLTQHADAYREISLLMRKTPAREAYPGDIFYLHAKLLERAVYLKSGGSVTMLPIIETLEGDVSAFIPTNVISITDGQIYMDKEIFIDGFKPAINIGLSVSRIGSSAQHKNMRAVTGSLKGELSQYIELERFAKSMSDLDDFTRKNLEKGAKLLNLFNQKLHGVEQKHHIIIKLFAQLNDLIPYNVNYEEYLPNLYEYIKNNDKNFNEELIQNSDFKDAEKKKLKDLILKYNKEYYEAI